MVTSPGPALRAPAGIAALLLTLGGCGAGGGSDDDAGPSPYGKVLMVVEENKTYDEVLSSGRAPYLAELADTYGSARKMDAGYPEHCPSLAAYIILTSGDSHGICDDRDPDVHQIEGQSIFGELTDAGKDWRLYGQSMPEPCTLTDRAGRFAVRHLPSAYYTQLRDGCAAHTLPMDHAFTDDVSAGKLPALSFLIPDLCSDMHGGEQCSGDPVRTGDDWLRDTLPKVMNGPDYKSGKLAIVITWDEGSDDSNHIPTLVVSPTTRAKAVDAEATHCSTLATISQVLGVDPLGCAADARSLAHAFGLA